MTTLEDKDIPELVDGEELIDFYSSIYGIDLSPERDTAVALYTYGAPVLLVIGTFSNIISAIILFKMCQKVLSTCLYLFVLTMLDLIVLYVRCGNDWLQHLTHVNVQRIAMFSSNSVCKIFPFVSNFALHLSIWLVVAMVTETTIVTLKRDRLLRACVLERGKAVILLIIVLLVCINAHCFWTFALEEDEKSGLPGEIICTNARQGHINETFRRVVWPIIDMIVADLFPFFTVFACTVIIITRRVRGKDFTREAQNIWKSYPLDAPAARDFQTTILAVCIFYLILMLPKFACDIFQFLVDPNALALVEWSLVLDAKTTLGQAVCSLLHYTCLSCKFFVYLSSRKFREELKTLITCRQCRRRVPKRDPTSPQASSRCLLSDKKPPAKNVQNTPEKKPFAITSV